MILHTQEMGQGPAILLVHGFCEDLHIWQDFAKVLSKNYRVLMVDLPGFGQSPRYAEQPSIEQWATDIAATLDGKGVAQCVVVGHSLGGYAGLALARLFPEKLLGLSLFHSTAYSDDEAKKENRAKVAAFVREHGTKAFLSGLFPTLFAEFNRAAFVEQCNILVQRAQSIDAEAIAQTSLLMANRPDSAALLPTLPFPVQFIIGKHDQAVPFERSQSQCLLPAEAWVHALATVGHMGMFEAPEATLAALAGFLRRCCHS